MILAEVLQRHSRLVPPHVVYLPYAINLLSQHLGIYFGVCEILQLPWPY